jgi:hypothetical protein
LLNAFSSSHSNSMPAISCRATPLIVYTDQYIHNMPYRLRQDSAY